MSDYAKNADFEKIAADIISYLPCDVDVREGSVIFNAVAGVAARIAELYADMDRFERELDPYTASRDGLERACAQRDITPFKATASIILGKFKPKGLPIQGKRFAVNGIVFNATVLEAEGEDYDLYQLECETEGERGNIMGALVPLLTITGLETAYATDIYSYGEDAETDESLRQRYMNSFLSYGFAGNIAYYKDNVNGLSGVGACRIYPVWNGGGTVKIVFVTSSFDAPDEALVAYVQDAIDPVDAQGTGSGIAPIGHTVTVEGAGETVINVSATLTMMEGYTEEDAISDIKEAIYGYLAELNSGYADKTINVRLSQLESRILAVETVEDIEDVRINGVASNYVSDNDNVMVGGTFNGL